MADYKVVDAEKLNADLSGLAKAIHTKAETSGGLVFPEGFISAVNGIQKGIIPTGTKNITQNGPFDVTEFAEALVNVQPSSDYIKKSDTWNYTTQFAYGHCQVSSDTLISDFSMNDVGFKPKVFFLRNNKAIVTTSSRYYLQSVIVVVNNNYELLFVYPDGSTKTTVGFSAGVFYSSSKATTVQTNSVNNLLHPTDNGVAGNGSSGASVYLKASTPYFWFAWG